MDKSMAVLFFVSLLTPPVNGMMLHE